MELRFSDGTIIKIPPSVNPTEYLYRNFPNRVREYAERLEFANQSFREIDAKSKWLKCHNKSTTIN